MAFTVFESRSKQVGSPAVSVTPTGAMRLNKDASDILKSLGATHVLILWDEENSKLALSTTPASDHRAYKLSYHPKGSGVAFAAKAFLKHIGWSAKSAVPLKLSLQKGMLQGDVPAENIKPFRPSTKKSDKPPKQVMA